MARLLRLFALFVVVALVILGALVRDIHSEQGEHFSSSKAERHLIVRQNSEILELLREGK